MSRAVRMLSGLVTGALVIAVAACGGGDGDGGGSSSPAQRASSPEELGQLISKTYIELISEVRPIVESRPEPAQLRARLQGIKDGYIETFVAFGKQREALSEPDRAKVDSAALVYLSANGPRDVAWSNEATTFYRTTYPELGKTLGEINILSQYAYFDLLKKQDPEEARRLGID